MFFILDGKIPKKCTFQEWDHFFHYEERRILKTEINEYEISTVFIGIDTMLFETVTVISKNEMLYGRLYRASTWVDAEADHIQRCEDIMNTILRKNQGSNIIIRDVYPGGGELRLKPPRGIDL